MWLLWLTGLFTWAVLDLNVLKKNQKLFFGSTINTLWCVSVRMILFFFSFQKMFLLLHFWLYKYNVAYYLWWLNPNRVHVGLLKAGKIFEISTLNCWCSEVSQHTLDHFRLYQETGSAVSESFELNLLVMWTPPHNCRKPTFPLLNNVSVKDCAV